MDHRYSICSFVLYKVVYLHNLGMVTCLNAECCRIELVTQISVKSSPPTSQHRAFTGGPSSRPANNIGALKAESITFHGFARPKLTWMISVLVLATKGFGVGSIAKPVVSPLMPVPLYGTSVRFWEYCEKSLTYFAAHL